MRARARWLIGLIILTVPATLLQAGGSGLNVLVVVNQASTNSVQLGNYFAERRHVPPQNVLRINWPGGNVQWTSSDLDTYLLNPVVSALASRQLTNQIDCIALSMDIPYRVTTDTNGANSTTSALFYGFKPDSHPACSMAPGSTNWYAGSEGIFRQTSPINTGSNSWLVMMITSSNLAQAEALVDTGVSSDATFPTNRIWLEKTTDTARNVRYTEFDNTEFNFRVRGSAAVVQTNSNQTSGLGGLLGMQTGLASFGISSNTFVRGAMADSLTSYGGTLFEGTGQTSLLLLIQAGASGSYGTVVEPCNYLEKFPNSQNYFYQLRGFSLAECYYLSVTNPYMGLLVGEPLAAPFALPGSGAWPNLGPGAVLAGTTNLFIAADAGRPLQQVDLFLDGQFFATLTNIPPQPGNQVQAVVNGQTLSYTVESGDKIADVASGLAASFNSYSNPALFKVSAAAHGDRVELQSTDTNRAGIDTANSVASLTNTASILTTFLSASQPSFLDTTARGRREIDIAGTLVVGDYLQLSVTKTNGATVSVSVTNTSSSTDVGQFVQIFVSAINAASDLQGADGLTVEDFGVEVLNGQTGLAITAFNLRPRSAGWAAARLQVQVIGTFSIMPAISRQLDENLSDLQPRNHFYITAGITNLALTFPFDTTTQADGFHELTAVAYEGSHVRTQTRVSQTVVIQNTPLAATFTTLVGDTNAALEATLQFSVAANTNNIAEIALLGTGGWLAGTTNQSSAVFSVAGMDLGIGLHPFCALVTRADGKQYRTETKWIRIIGAEPPFGVSYTPPPALSWPATAGRRYDVLSATNVTDAFQVRDSVTPTNAAGQWNDTNAVAEQQFYRVRTSP